AEAVEPAAGGVAGGGRRHALELAEVDELLADLHLAVEPALFGEVPHPALRLRPDGLPAERDAAFVRRRDEGDHPDRGRLPGAVGAEDAEDAAGRGGERDVVHGRERAGARGAVGDVDRVPEWDGGAGEASLGGAAEA